MRVFGIHQSSILWLFLSLMTVAVAAFLLRFPDSRALVAVASLSALILMFASPLGTTTENISQIPVGGYRYFSLLAAIPGMHIFLELISKEKQSWRPSQSPAGCCCSSSSRFSQSPFLSTSRQFTSTGRSLSERLTRFIMRAVTAAQLYKVIFIVAVVGATLVASRAVAPAGYKEATQNGDMIPGRVLVALGSNPNWPFGTLAEEYRGCWPEDPDRTLEPGIHDFNLACIWSDYAERQHMSRAEMAAFL
jgi:hypothetical protein